MDGTNRHGAYHLTQCSQMATQLYTIRIVYNVETDGTDDFYEWFRWRSDRSKRHAR